MTVHAMNRKRGKIHFVHHLEKGYVPANLGDWISSPYYYFTEFFSRYSCVLHSDWAVLWHEIERDDVVIFGGGGLLDNSDELNKVLNRLIEKCDNVIIWGAGTHKYTENNIFGKRTASIPIRFDKTVLSGIRDYQHPYEQPFVPCASCLHPAFSADRNETHIKREVGTLKSALERTFAVSDVPSSVSNAESIGTVVDYILSSRVMLVSSYHGAFWSMLLGRKVILPTSRLGVDKYKYFRHPVGFYDGNKFDEPELLRLAATIPEPVGFLAEARALNLDFFRKVRNHIEERVETVAESETIQILAKRTAQLEFTLNDMWGDIRRMNGRLAELEKAKAAWEQKG
ncbi:MAG TPA: hypothetical protein PKY87_04325 [Terricaulis sp.]|nr:hypothetical protein [Terricaulis sp.]